MLADYLRQGEVTDPGPHSALFADLPHDVTALCRVVQGLVLHIAWAERAGLEVTGERRGQLAIRTVAQQLATIMAQNPQALSTTRPLAGRLLGTCRDFALLLCSILRHQGVPARVRCGFATYFEPNRYEDHWICEHWLARERRWCMTDAQLDAAMRGWLKFPFDPTDLPRGQFLPAGQAWRLCRAGEAAPADFGQGQAQGLWFMRVNVVRDLLALAKREISPWDTWRQIPAADRTLDAPALARCDQLAGVTADDAWEQRPMAELQHMLEQEIPPPWLK